MIKNIVDEGHFRYTLDERDASLLIQSIDSTIFA